MLHVDDCRYVPDADLRMTFLEEGVEVFFGWLLLEPTEAYFVATPMQGV